MHIHRLGDSWVVAGHGHESGCMGWQARRPAWRRIHVCGWFRQLCGGEPGPRSRACHVQPPSGEADLWGFAHQQSCLQSSLPIGLQCLSAAGSQCLIRSHFLNRCLLPRSRGTVPSSGRGSYLCASQMVWGQGAAGADSRDGAAPGHSDGAPVSYWPQLTSLVGGLHRLSMAGLM